MARILVLYYSAWGHVERMAQAIADGVGDAGCQVDIKRVPELVSDEILQKAQYKTDQPAPVAQVEDLIQYDGIIFGTPTRFGNMCAQMRNFMDQTGAIWTSGGLVGKVASVFTSTGTGGGNETTITSFHYTLLHHGMIIVGLPYTCAELANITDVHGGSPYGAATIAGAQGERQPSEVELTMARFQGRHVAEITRRLVG